MKQILYLFLMLGGGSLCAQGFGISPQVLNAAGKHSVLGSTGVSISDNVGEPFTTAIGPVSNAMITQGFLQPETYLDPTFLVTIVKNDVTCKGKGDGNISTAISAATSGFNAQYIWTPTLACPGGNCSGLDSLGAGQYSLSVIITFTNLANVVKTDTVIKDSLLVIKDLNGPCKVKVYTGVNISGTNTNDHMYIENIEEYPNNRVTVYSRWGLQLYDQKGYDNAGKSWPSHDEQSKLLAGTYFYVIEIGDGSKPMKGWIELIKN